MSICNLFIQCPFEFNCHYDHININELTGFKLIRYKSTLLIKLFREYILVTLSCVKM